MIWGLKGKIIILDCLFQVNVNSSINWLVVLTILKNISQWEGLSHILWKIKNVPNHQPVNVHFMLVPDIVLLQGSNLSAGSPKYAPSPLTYDACGMTSFRFSQLIQDIFVPLSLLNFQLDLYFAALHGPLSVAHFMHMGLSQNWGCCWYCSKWP
jgi:hypothetical protein